MIRRMHFSMAPLAALACLAAAAASAASGTDAIWGRAQADGSVTLTNVPDQNGYQVVVQGTASTASPITQLTPSAAAPQPRAAETPLQVVSETPRSERSDLAEAPAEVTLPAIAPDSLASAPAEPQQTLPTREAIQQEAAAAARTAAQTPEESQAMASAVAGRAAQDLATAGSPSERLTAMYQAAQGAYAATRAPASDHR